MNDCLSLFELSHGNSLTPPQAAHVRSCARCSALARAITGGGDRSPLLEPAVALEWPHSAVPDIDAKPQPGAVHSIWGHEDGDLLAAVIVDLDDHEALVVPVSPETHLAGDHDVLIDGAVLAYPAILEIWNHVQVLPEQLMERIGQIDEQLMTLIDVAVDAAIESEPFPAELHQGVPIVGEADPRRIFREQETQRAQKFVDPWRILNVADSLGTVLGARRIEKDLEPDAVSQHADLPIDVVLRLEADELNLRESVPVSHLGSLARWLDLCPSQRLGDLVEQAVFHNDRGTAPGSPLAMARRRRGARSTESLLPEDLRREHARDYAQQLLARMREA